MYMHIYAYTSMSLLLISLFLLCARKRDLEICVVFDAGSSPYERDKYMSKRDLYTRTRVLYTRKRDIEIGVDFDAGHYVYTRRQM